MTPAMFLVSIIILAAAAYFFYRSMQRRNTAYTPPTDTAAILAQNVTFYTNLDAANKAAFEARVKDFLSYVTVRGVDVAVDDTDRILVASGAIIPIFAFPGWRYNNISEVLLYKGTFSKEYSTDEGERNVLGMVGDGAMHREMIISQPSLRASFRNDHDGHNTVIHEFAHLIDKADGATDGIPEYLLAQPAIIPWVARMRDTINEMKKKGRSDINLYGATNDAEFFAVMAEYFFEKPEQLKDKHPELYSMLETMFQPIK